MEGAAAEARSSSQGSSAWMLPLPLDAEGFNAGRTLGIPSLLIPVGLTRNQKYSPKTCPKSGLEEGTLCCWGRADLGGSHPVWICPWSLAGAHTPNTRESWNLYPRLGLDKPFHEETLPKIQFKSLLVQGIDFMMLFF